MPAHTYEQVVEGTMMTLLSDAWSMQVTLLKQEGDGERDCDKNTTTAANDKGNGEEGANQDGDRAAGSSQDIVEDTYEAEGAGPGPQTLRTVCNHTLIPKNCLQHFRAKMALIIKSITKNKLFIQGC